MLSIPNLKAENGNYPGWHLEMAGSAVADFRYLIWRPLPINLMKLIVHIILLYQTDCNPYMEADHA
jgi:hypothetical protein